MQVKYKEFEKNEVIITENLARKINLSENTICKVMTLYSEEKENIELYAAKCISESFAVLNKKSPLFRLAVILTLAVKVKDKYNKAGISEEIYYDTMSDIKIWSDKCNGEGLKNCSWLKNHVSFELFKIGRLQFQLYECTGRTVLYKKLPFDYGERVVYVHIPEGEKLDKKQCESALKKANEFFRSYFPDFNYSYYFCESWLLFEGNREFMSADSNIVNFMSLFDICYSVKIDKQAIERIFGKRRLFKKYYPEKTSLQKRAKQYMLKGKSLGVGVGVIEKITIK